MRRAGPIVDRRRLISALREHRIAGAAVDVFDVEPLPIDHPYRSLDNMLATPHIGYVSQNLYRTFYGDTVKNIVCLVGWFCISNRGMKPGFAVKAVSALSSNLRRPRRSRLRNDRGPL